MPKWCNDDVMVTALLRRRQTDVRSDLGSIDILHILHFYNLLTVAAMSDDDSELMQMQALWNDAKQELNRLRKLKKVNEKKLAEKDSRIKDLTKLFEDRKSGIEQALLEYKGKEKAFEDEIKELHAKLEDEIKVRRGMEQDKYDLEFNLENEMEQSNHVKLAHEKIQISYEHVLKEYTEAKEKNRGKL